MAVVFPLWLGAVEGPDTASCVVLAIGAHVIIFNIILLSHRCLLLGLPTSSSCSFPEARLKPSSSRAGLMSLCGCSVPGRFVLLVCALVSAYLLFPFCPVR